MFAFNFICIFKVAILVHICSHVQDECLQWVVFFFVCDALGGVSCVSVELMKLYICTFNIKFYFLYRMSTADA